MLKIDYGCPDNIYFNVDIEFDLLFEMGWLEDSIVQKILNDIDNCYWNGVTLIDKDTGYAFPIHSISGGSKGLILCQCLDEDPIEIWGTMFSDNCTNLLLEIASNKDVVIYLEHYLKFNKEQFNAYSVKQSKMYNDYNDYFRELSAEVAKWK